MFLAYKITDLGGQLSQLAESEPSTAPGTVLELLEGGWLIANSSFYILLRAGVLTIELTMKLIITYVDILTNRSLAHNSQRLVKIPIRTRQRIYFLGNAKLHTEIT